MKGTGLVKSEWRRIRANRLFLFRTFDPDFRAEGPVVRPAQGNALGNGTNQSSFVGPTGQQFSRRTVGPLGRRGSANAINVPQGVALGWANRCPVGAADATKSKKLHP